MLRKKFAKNIGLLCCLCFLQPRNIIAQDANPDGVQTMRLSLKEAEQMFLDHNLELLAQHYNMQSSAALVEQARKWDNPVLNTDQNIYSNGRFFQHSTDASGNPQGEIYAQVQQLIKTAGKRGKQIDAAKANADIAVWQFKGVLRSLRATLMKDYYTVALLQGNKALYEENKAQLTRLLDALQKELQGGNVARKEYLRIQALLVSLQQDIAENDKSMSDTQSELKTVLGLTGNTTIEPVLADSESTVLPSVTLAQLVDSAKLNNTDYQQEMQQLHYSLQYVRLQKALAAPDVTIGTEFDQAANYAPNYYGLAISLPLPLWDRNQGNIKSAKFQVKQQETMVTQAYQKLQNDVLNAYQKLLLTVRLSAGSNAAFYKDYYQLQKNIVESYNKRQLSLIEFLDYFNDYRDVRMKQLQQILNLRLAKEELNDVVGTDIIK